MTIKEILLHRWLAVPYTLHSTVRPPISSKNIQTVLFIHGIGNSGESWSDVIKMLPDNCRIITIDLLGFGKSPQPSWATYSAKLQARAVITTYLRLRIRGKVTIIGHSLGSLVAIEFAKRYPLLVKSLILCSPPFYKIDEGRRRLLPSSDRLHKDMYHLARRHPEQFIKISTLAVKLGLVNKSYNLTRDNAAVYMNALEATIINQTSLQDAMKLHMPIRIIYGRLDPIVVMKSLRLLSKAKKNVSLTSVLAGHEIKGSFIKAVASAIAASIDN